MDAAGRTFSDRSCARRGIACRNDRGACNDGGTRDDRGCNDSGALVDSGTRNDAWALVGTVRTPSGNGDCRDRAGLLCSLVPRPLAR
jgi:hypothetical protein